MNATAARGRTTTGLAALALATIILGGCAPRELRDQAAATGGDTTATAADRKSVV